MQPSSWARLAIALCIIAVVVVVATVFPVRAYSRVILGWVRDCGVMGPLVMIAIYIPAAVLLVPASWLTLSAGFFFGPLLGTAVASAGSVLGACLAFALGRTVAHDMVTRRVERQPALKSLGAAVESQGFRIVLLTRLSPVLPFAVLNYLFSVSRVTFRDFLVASFLGMLPATLLYAYLGSAAQSALDVESAVEPTSWTVRTFFVVGLVATIAVTVLVTRLARQALRDAVPEQGRGRGEE